MATIPRFDGAWNFGSRFGISDSDAQILYFVGSIVLAGALVGVTVYYALQNRRMAKEMRRQNDMATESARRDQDDRRSRRLAHWSAMRAEVDLCAGLARTYTNPRTPASPLWRLPTIVYTNAFPVLLADAVVDGSETNSILRFYSQVEQINRGLGYVQAAESDREFMEERDRLRIKAHHLVDPDCPDPGGPYYQPVRELIERHIAQESGVAGTSDNQNLAAEASLR